MDPVKIRIRFRRNTLETWLKLNPILAEGEPAYEIGTEKVKIGNGVNRWVDLKYRSESFSSETPVPTAPGTSLPEDWDDGPSLLLIYQNAKV